MADWDLVIVGAGLGGSALVSRFVGSGLKVLLVERGDYIKPGPENWDPHEVIAAARYALSETWMDEDGSAFSPRTYYNVGGSSKFFGGTAFRLREADFRSRQYPEGQTPDWPISYADLAPWYDEAERSMFVHGLAAADPSEPPREPYPFPPTSHEPAIGWLNDRLSAAGLRPFPLPVAVDQHPGGRCRKGSPCDGFPCRIRAKGDGENAFLRPALAEDPNIVLRTNTFVEKLISDPSGQKVVGALVTGPDGPGRLTARVFVLAAGAVNSAALLLRSGLANRSDLVGRHIMAHNNSVIMALSPWRKNPTKFQKTLAMNDFYPGSLVEDGVAAGNIQMRGKILPENLASYPSSLVRRLRNVIAPRSFDFWVMSEDLPDPENRVTIADGGRIRLVRNNTNMGPHKLLVRDLVKTLRRIGLPIVFVRHPRKAAIQHQCGTLRFGDDPETSVLNVDCRSWDLDNLYVSDASFFPSSASVNPALTVAANALRVGDLVRRRLEAARHQKP